MYSPRRKKGNIAEDLVTSHLQKDGNTVLERNYLRKWGEIDLICLKNDVIHFIEVKSLFLNDFDEYYSENMSWNMQVSRETNVSRETDDGFDPVWNMTNLKKKRLSKAIRSYLAEKYSDDIPDFQIDLITVSLDNFRKIWYITVIDNIILGDL